MGKEKVVVSEEEINSLIDVLSNCKDEALKAAQAIYNADSEMKGKVYEGTGVTAMDGTYQYLYSGMARLSVIYEQLGVVLGEFLKEFKQIDKDEGKKAKDDTVKME